MLQLNIYSSGHEPRDLLEALDEIKRRIMNGELEAFGVGETGSFNFQLKETPPPKHEYEVFLDCPFDSQWGEGWKEFVIAETAQEARDIARERVRKATEQPDLSLDTQIISINGAYHE